MNLKSISRDPDLFTKSDVCSIRNLVFGLDFIFLPLQLSFEQKPHVCPPMNWKPKRAELLLVNRSRFSLIKNWGNVFISQKKGEEARHINIKEDLESQICEIEIAPRHQSCENNFSKVSIFQTRKSKLHS